MRLCNSFVHRKDSIFWNVEHKVRYLSFFRRRSLCGAFSPSTPFVLEVAYRRNGGSTSIGETTASSSSSSEILAKGIKENSRTTDYTHPVNRLAASTTDLVRLSSHVKVRVFDRFGMPVMQHPGSMALGQFEDLLSLAPSPLLKEQLEKFLHKNRWHSLSRVQSSTIPIILHRLDTLCIAPTATGKTFIYVFSAMVQLVMSDMYLHQVAGPTVSGSDVEELVRQKIQRGEICRYCELSIAENKICPMTGTIHPEVEEVKLMIKNKRERTDRLEGLEGEAKPRVIVLVPTSTLVHQVFLIFKELREQFRVRYLVRASSAEEQQKYLNGLKGVDILISTPETLLPALYKKKLSTAKVQIFIADEIDDLVSNNHFEALKMLLAALPKGMRRPQRMLFGASLPPVAYQMIRDRMLLPTHRFILCEKEGPDTGAIVPHSSLPSSTGGARGGTTARLFWTSTPTVAHVVLMVTQSEKIQKLLWLYRTEKISPDQRTIIFCNSRHNAAYVADRLKAQLPELHVLTISSRSSDTAKMATWKLFHSGISCCLVSTDILSRGMDFQKVVNVVQYDAPQDITTWIHRSGRCGRNGKRGYSFTFFQPENVKLAKPLVSYLRANHQVIPPKLQEYARQSFLDVARNSIFQHPTRTYRHGDPQNHTPPFGKGAPRYPDYRQDRLNKHYRPH